jgi:hypothetical protein
LKISFQKGDIPMSRSFHSAVIYKNEIYIYGGINFDTERIFSALHSFHFGLKKFFKKLETQTWSCIKYTNGEDNMPSVSGLLQKNKSSFTNSFKLESQINNPNVFGHSAVVIDDKM